MLDELEFWVVAEVSDIVVPAGNKIVDRDDFKPVGQPTIAKVGADKSGTTRYENTQRGGLLTSMVGNTRLPGKPAAP